MEGQGDDFIISSITVVVVDNDYDNNSSSSSSSDINLQIAFPGNQSQNG